MNVRQYLFCAWIISCLLMLASCDSKIEKTGSSDSSSKAESYAASSVTPQEDIKRNPELEPVIVEIAMEPVGVSCGATEFSSGSLALNADNELLLEVSKIFSKNSFEELDLAQQPQYARFVRVTSARGADDWTLTFLEESKDGGEAQGQPATFLSLMRQGYPEPVFFSLDRTVFDELYKMANDRVYFVEPPAEEFVEPLRRLLDGYRNGTVKNNELEPRFDPFPEGEKIPDVESAEDFTVEPGNEMVSYYAVISIGDGAKYKIAAGMAHMYPPFGSDQPQEPHWAAVSASVRTSD